MQGSPRGGVAFAREASKGGSEAEDLALDVWRRRGGSERQIRRRSSSLERKPEVTGWRRIVARKRGTSRGDVGQEGLGRLGGTSNCGAGCRQAGKIASAAAQQGSGEVGGGR